MIEIPVSNVSWSDDDLAGPSETSKKPFKAAKSISCEITMTKEMRKYLREMNRTQPNLKHPRRKCAWRLRRKWFNRYQKPRIIGMMITAQTEGGPTIPMKIRDVKISKGYPGVLYEYQCTPQL